MSLLKQQKLRETPSNEETVVITNDDEDGGVPLGEDQLAEVEMTFGRGSGEKSILVTGGTTLKKLSEMSTK